ncbi:hypothetical protein [Fodinicurvata sp. EGI_FJ10296]|uniref:hypothetical protein n=1 Tax=Fodinicurvata sp. EGI_FJ10296 TaxID=3231908 RepID=UPI003452D1A2
MRRTDIISALILLAISGYGVGESLTFPSRAAAWPLWMWGALLVSSLGLLVQAVLRKQ